MSENWISIRYRDFYDVPRAFVVERGGDMYLFDCLFDHDLDDYQDTYTVYVVKPDLRQRIESISWTDLGNQSMRVGTVLTGAVRFDSTKRKAVEEGVFELIENERAVLE